jgi:Na+-translocating ferredoxin:NAD+ oxidoreductase subunit B
MTILYAFLILAGFGALFGLGLGIASIVFYVKEDKRIEEVTKMLPNANCGACGYAGCNDLAKALVTGKEEHVSRCKVGKKEKTYDPIIAYLEAHPNDDGTKVNVKL